MVAQGAESLNHIKSSGPFMHVVVEKKTRLTTLRILAFPESIAN